MHGLGEGHGFRVFGVGGLLRRRVGQRVERDGLVLGVLDLLEMDVGDLLVLDAGGVVVTDEAWDFRQRHNVLF